jgi:dienelactone hydrolase
MVGESVVWAGAVAIPAGPVSLSADLTIPWDPHGLAVFAHGSGSSRHSPRNRLIAEVLQEAGFATLLMDLLTEAEEAVDRRTRALRFDIPLLAGRLRAAADWVGTDGRLSGLPLGTFGASTGAAAALMLAADLPERVAAVVSRGGRPDLAGAALERVSAPVLLVVGGADDLVLKLNEGAREQMARADVRLEVVPGATHLFPEPGALERVGELARDWFVQHLT